MLQLRHECNTCKKTFDRKERLQKHIKQDCNHTTCKICFKKFRDGRSLQKHQNSHKPSKRECGICGRMFKSVKYLENHKKNAKQTDCDVCGTAFCQLSEMERHKRTSHFGMRSGGNIANDDLNQKIYPKTGFEEEEGYIEQIKAHWNMIRDSKKEMEFYTELNTTLTPDLTYNDLTYTKKDFVSKICSK